MQTEKLGIRGFGTAVLRDRHGRVKAVRTFRNMATTAGLNMMLNVMFRGTTPSTSWYVGLINNTPTPTLAAGDTMSSHAGWSEATSFLSNSTRPAWAPGAASAGLLSAAAAAHTFNNTGTVYGIFIADNNTKGGTSGNLWATAPLDSPLAVVNTDTLTITYQTQLQAVA